MMIDGRDGGAVGDGSGSGEGVGGDNGTGGSGAAVLTEIIRF